jgi:hypothetical protein
LTRSRSAPGIRPVEHLDDVEPGAERRVHGAHLEADDPAAEDEHALGVVSQLERPGRGDDARVVLRQERQLHRFGPGGDDRPREGDGLAAPRGQRDLDLVRAREHAGADDDPDLAHLRHLGEAAGQLADDLVLVRGELGAVDRRSAERHADVGEVRRLVHHGGDVQQRLRRDAADVEADAAERRIALDEHDPEAEVGGAEGRGIATGPRAEHEDVAGDVGGCGARSRPRLDAARRRGGGGLGGRGRRRAVAHRRRGLGRGGGGRRRGGSGRGHGGAAALQHQHQRAHAHLVADRDLELFHDARRRRRDLHRRLVALDRDQALLRLDRVARLDQHLDDGDLGEVADVRDLDLLAHSSTRRKSPRICAR